ncbi:MAG: acyl-CoA thioesterase [Moraxellaceae bacterium]|nr:acyl-CoA thioesterase [Pseudobdellovibrionaceae bacterium]
MSYELVIKEHHLDTFGHVNNAVYLQLFEEARWEFITSRGYGLKEVVKFQKGPVILEANIKFLKELKLRETVKITFETLPPKGRIIQIKQQMIKSNGDVSSELIVTIGFFDLQQRKLIAPSTEWLKVLNV